LWIYHGWGTSQIQTSSMRRCNFKSQSTTDSSCRVRQLGLRGTIVAHALIFLALLEI
jgi:hypothetical protein